MGRSRSRSPRYRDRDRRRRSRSPRSRRSRSPRRRRSRSPGGHSRRARSPHGSYRGGGYDEKRRRDEAQWKNAQDAQLSLTLGGSLGVNQRKKKKKQQAQPNFAPIQPEDVTDEDKMMQQLMGFNGFDSTKGKKVANNDVYAINRKVERKYRQYMNRKGGFNRPLDFMQ